MEPTRQRTPGSESALCNSTIACTGEGRSNATSSDPAQVPGSSRLCFPNFVGSIFFPSRSPYICPSLFCHFYSELPCGPWGNLCATFLELRILSPLPSILFARPLPCQRRVIFRLAQDGIHRVVLYCFFTVLGKFFGSLVLHIFRVGAAKTHHTKGCGCIVFVLLVYHY